MKISDLGGGKNYDFLFFNTEKIFKISRIEEHRNFVRATTDGIEFVVYSGSDVLGASDRQTNRIKIMVEKSGNLTVTVTAEREMRSLWVLAEKTSQVYVLEMTRLAEPCNVPEATESVRVLEVPGKR